MKQYRKGEGNIRHGFTDKFAIAVDNTTYIK